jgi:FtsZ-binding cell division protein ZapB
VTDEVKAEVNMKEAKQPPSSLPSYLKGSASAGRYVAAIGHEAKIPDEAERFAALEIVASDPKLLTKVVELMRALLDPSHSRARGAIKPWATDVIRARDPDLARWAQLAGRSPDDEIADLAKRLSQAGSDRDKEKVSEAEQVLLLGITITSMRADFDVVGALASIHAVLNRDEQADRTKRRAAKAVAAATMKQLNIYGAINQVVSGQLKSLTEQFASVRHDRDLARERIRDLQDTITRLSSEVGELKEDKELAENAAETLRQQLDGTKGGAAHDMIEARARFRRLLTGRLSPFVSDAGLALEVTPPVVNIAKERLGQIKGEIDKELEWLKQFSD